MSADISDPPSSAWPGAPAAGPEALYGLEERARRAESESEHLRRALESRGRIATAVGVLAERLGCTSEQAWAFLVRVSSVSNVKVRDLAGALVDDLDGRPDRTDPVARTALADRLPARRVTADAGASPAPRLETGGGRAPGPPGTT